MENDIWNEISSFLNQLRCENINRESYIYFQELANIQLKKKMEKEKVNKLLDHISYEDREKLKQYGEILEEEAFVSEQRAYCQGYVDCIQLLAGLGLLKKSTDMEKIISEMKSKLSGSWRKMQYLIDKRMFVKKKQLCYIKL